MAIKYYFHNETPPQLIKFEFTYTTKKENFKDLHNEVEVWYLKYMAEKCPSSISLFYHGKSTDYSVFINKESIYTYQYGQ